MRHINQLFRPEIVAILGMLSTFSAIHIGAGLLKAFGLL